MADNSLINAQSLLGNTGSDTSTTSGVDISSPSFTDKLAETLLGQAGMVSSSASNIDSTIADSINKVQTSTNDNNTALGLEYGQKESDVTDQAGNDLTNGRASGANSALNMAALKELTDTTDKNIRDLEQQKQQFILQNNAAAASKIADLQVQALTLKQDANQKVFSNLLQLGQYGIQAQQEKQATQAAQDAHTKTIVQMIQDNPQAGITMNDNIDQAAAKIGKNPNSPDIQLKKAQIAKAYSDIKNAGTNTGTETERADALVSSYSSKFVPGAKMADGTPLVDNNGFVTPTAFKTAIKEIPASAKDAFIKSLASQFYSGKDKTTPDYSAYGLTAKQVKDNITG